MARALDVTRLAARLSGRLWLPGSEDYEQIWSSNQTHPVLPIFPQAIAHCARAEDVALALDAATAAGISIACRSGGHSTARFSICDGLVIDVAGIDYVRIDVAQKLARVGSGVRLGPLNASLAQVGLHVPGGTCPEVGVAGHFQSGGYGLTSRIFGLHCDAVRSATVMLADTRIVLASEDVNPDLFWAIRGGTGNNFGVVIDIEYSLRDLGDIWGFAFEWSGSDCVDALDEIQTRFTVSERESLLGYLALLHRDPARGPVLLFIGMFTGTEENGRFVLEPLLRIGAPRARVSAVGPYATLNDSLFDVLPRGMPAGSLKHQRSRCLNASIPPLHLRDLVAHVASSPTPFDVVVLEPYGAAIREVSPQATAFIHRDISMNALAVAFSGPALARSSVDRSQAWLSGVLGLLAPYSNGHVTPNYPERDLADYRWAYWGNAFPTLAQVKKKFDPGDVFSFPQGISDSPNGVDLRRSTALALFPATPIDSTARRRD